MKDFIKTFKWELSRITRFPLLEIIFALLVFQVALNMFYLSHISGTGVQLFYSGIVKNVEYLYPHDIGAIIINYLGDIFILMSLIGTILCANFLASEIDNGSVKLFISHPITKTNVFWSKYFSILLILVFATFLPLIVAFSLHDPRFILEMFKGYSRILALGYVLICVSFFVTSLAFALSSVTKNVALTAMGSLGILIVINMVSSSHKYLPGRSLNAIVSLFTGARVTYLTHTQQIIAVVFMPVAGAILVLLAYCHFSRRLELP